MADSCPGSSPMMLTCPTFDPRRKKTRPVDLRGDGAHPRQRLDHRNERDGGAELTG